MAGDEIRGATFPRVAGGYSRGAVDYWLADAAACLDAQIPPATVMPPPRFIRSVRGYDIAAVNQLISALGCPEPVKPAGRRIRLPPGYETDCDAEWRRVAELPGTRLRWRHGGWGSFSDVWVVDSDDQVLVTHSNVRTLTVAAIGQVLRWSGRRGEAYVDAATGIPVLWTIGVHTHLRAETAVLFPVRRWLRFPVQGTSPHNAVMTAIDESGTPVLWFGKMQPGPALGLGPSPAYEVIVSPDCDLTPELLGVIALARSWLDDYFEAPGGGG